MFRKPAFLCGVLLACSCSREAAFDLTIRNVSLVDLDDGVVARNVNVGVSEGKITYVGANPVDARQVISGEGLWALPGLWDMHVHISDPSFFPLFTMNGVVGVRDMGGALDKPQDGCGSIAIDTLGKWREDIRLGVLQGPEIVLAGPVLSGTAASGSLKVTTPAEARTAVARVTAAGSDFIKVYEDIPPEALAAIAEAADETGMVFAGHVSEETQTILGALQAGQRSVEHVRSHLLLCFAETDAELEQLYIADGWDAEDRAWAKRHRESCPAVWSHFRRKEVWLTPTLAVQETLDIGGLQEFVEDPRRSTLPPSIVRYVEARGEALRQRTAEETREARNWNRYIHLLVKRANAEGTAILAGSDAACEGVIPGFGLHRELELLVQAGLTPLRALQAATIQPARYFGRQDEIGKIAQGFEADIVLLRRNPLEDISAIADIDAVIVDGEIASHAASD